MTLESRNTKGTKEYEGARESNENGFGMRGDRDIRIRWNGSCGIEYRRGRSKTAGPTAQPPYRWVRDHGPSGVGSRSSRKRLSHLPTQGVGAVRACLGK